MSVNPNTISVYHAFSKHYNGQPSTHNIQWQKHVALPNQYRKLVWSGFFFIDTLSLYLIYDYLCMVLKSITVVLIVW